MPADHASSPESGRQADPGARYCDRCGQPAGHEGSAGCTRARVLEPPRYCSRCRRRMVVQVTPSGWSARCSEHGLRTA
jgi:hypothetical protein